MNEISRTVERVDDPVESGRVGIGPGGTFFGDEPGVGQQRAEFGD